ncbi:1-deoxy-D-xylulose-5-phosphate reductoisomerase [Undibacterium sp. LX40W]|uniref:1-deoxy-D-xylulose 5-phosphate reductoisomerase n=1 Tax=Undibacterium nitidum TaxID=2762298 RepID=A0A923HJ73_9BURK|nr:MULTISPECIES: 1-deoxy-D-xylulose-5-phosphate reductoisomerase [Undibacterium]MBC3880047.1 1-deoxy-D-xylulose-5-phosphate reductoisomerase [Undibacterium nitidum]MBC3891217.1 1-deoxy-D-xylulose-5-phosphate reductoisomerase [Undibacterium sp. LX40W]
MAKQRITILGSTGSIGVSTLDVIGRHSDRYETFALTAHTQIDKLFEQCLKFWPQYAVVSTPELASELQEKLKLQGIPTVVLYGAQALCDVATAGECDAVMAAIVGAAGLPSSLAAAQAGKRILLANKESLVMSGHIFMDAIAKSGATLLPIDSEHNAIFQCLPGSYGRKIEHSGISKIILTASGGPFLNRAVETLTDVTPDQAVAHPNWVMGRKISVDSATMMNKGLEVIEAHWLFGAPADQIDVLIHPQSVVHSMVSYVDGSVLAQMGNPDMRTPITFGLAFPERIDSGVAPLDLTTFSQLHFQLPDFQRFPCLGLAYQALRVGGSAATILNAANEIAVEAFLAGRLGFRQIESVIEECLNHISSVSLDDLAAILEVDGQARRHATGFVSRVGVH